MSEKGKLSGDFSHDVLDIVKSFKSDSMRLLGLIAVLPFLFFAFVIGGIFFSSQSGAFRGRAFEPPSLNNDLIICLCLFVTKYVS